MIRWPVPKQLRVFLLFTAMMLVSGLWICTRVLVARCWPRSQARLIRHSDFPAPYFCSRAKCANVHHLSWIRLVSCVREQVPPAYFSRS
jgi:hypothetical protein